MGRKIEPELVAYIEEKLLDNPAAQQAIAAKDARRIFVFAAEALLGIREATGHNDGKMVRLIQETVGGASNESWCMSYVQSCLAYAEIKSGIDSPLAVSELCWAVWTNSPKTSRVKRRPLRGAIPIWNYPPSTNGHTGILDEYEHKPGKMLTYEGNTTSGLKKDGTIESNGGGSYHCERSTKSGTKMKLLGFLKPF
jgi:hypothetical protein